MIELESKYKLLTWQIGNLYDKHFSCHLNPDRTPDIESIITGSMSRSLKYFLPVYLKIMRERFIMDVKKGMPLIKI